MLGASPVNRLTSPAGICQKLRVPLEHAAQAACEPVNPAQVKEVHDCRPFLTVCKNLISERMKTVSQVTRARGAPMCRHV